MFHSLSSTPLQLLVVDDELDVRVVLVALLREAGHNAIGAGDGAAALELFQSQHFDMVLTDRVMPEMDGERLATAIKELSLQTPVIMVTAFAPPSCCSSIDAIVRKPFTRASLAQAISQCLALSGQCDDSREKNVPEGSKLRV